METIVQQIEKIRQKIISSKLFLNPIIDFVLYNEELDEHLIGLYEQSNPQLRYLYAQKENTLYLEKNIKYYQNNSKLKKCLENYVLYSLQEKEYEIFFISINFHILLWKTINKQKNNLFDIYEGVQAYIQFCKLTGINIKLINEYADEQLSNILYLDDTNYYREELLTILDILNTKTFNDLKETTIEIISAYLDLIIDENNEVI